jgi:hypothetical protein
MLKEIEKKTNKFLFALQVKTSAWKTRSLEKGTTQQNNNRGPSPTFPVFLFFWSLAYLEQAFEFEKKILFTKKFKSGSG